MYMKQLLISLLFFAFLLSFRTVSQAQNEPFEMRQLACGLSQPWEIKFGPDGFLWVTEAHNYQITRVDPVTGDAEMLIDLSNKKNFPNFNEAETWPQGGLQGFAFHPDFENNPYFYLSYVYYFDECRPDTQGCYFKTKIVRYNYDMQNRVLSNEMVIVDTIPGSTDHNGGRLVVGPPGADTQFLFYGVGEMGAGQLSNAARPHHGQFVDYYEGKILRFNLGPDSDTSAYARWIPDDNPFNTNFEQNAVWSLGHRNPQGLVFGTDGKLYEAEHGPYSDDEINLIKPGYNYGFPLVMGYTDGNYDGSRAGDGSTMPDVPSEAANRAEIEASFPYSEPLISLFPATQSEVSTFYTNDLNNTPPYDHYYLQYATSAPSGMDYYSSDAIPGWKNSLLVANLKLANVYRFKLSDNGNVLVSDTIAYFQGLGRFRDIAISPDGTKIYVSADTVGAIKGAPGQAVQPPNKGCILEFSYVTSSTSQPTSAVDVKVFPNPASAGITKLLIDLDDYSDVSIDLYNGLGLKLSTLMPLQQTRNLNQTIDLRQYPPGNYFLKIRVNGEEIVKKVMVF